MPQNETREKLRAMSDDELERYGKAAAEYARTLDPGSSKMEQTGELLRLIREEKERRSARAEGMAQTQTGNRTRPVQSEPKKPKKKRGCFTAILVTGAVLIAVIILGAVFGKEEKPVSTEPSQAASANNQPGTVEEENSASDPGAPDPGAPDPAEESETPEESKSAVLAETVVYDSNNIKITAKEIYVSSLRNTEIKFLVENNSDKNIVYRADDVIINGITVPCWLYIDVAAGKKSNDSMLIPYSAIQTAGILDIATVACKGAQIVDTDTYDLLYNAPFSLETSIAGTYQQAINSDGDVIFEYNGVTVIAQIISDEYYGNSLQLFVKNDAGRDVVVQAENISVNGFTLSGWMYNTVYNGTVRYCDLDIFESGLEENGIEEIENVSFTIRITDPASYAELASSDEIQVFVN